MSDPTTAPDLWVPDYFSSQLPSVADDADTVDRDVDPSGALLDTVVAGDPAACRSTARLLDRSAAALDELAAALTTAARTPADVFGGQAGDAYRSRAETLGGRATAARDRARALAGGLDALAAGLQAAGEAMSRARLIALPTLVVGPDAVVRPSADAPPAHWRTWRQACAVAARGRALEAAAQSAWTTVLDAVTDAAAPAPGAGHPGAQGSAGQPAGDDRAPLPPGSPTIGAGSAVTATGSPAVSATGSPAGPAAGPSDGSATGATAGPSAGAAVQPVLTAQPFATDSQDGVLILGVPGSAESPTPPIDRCPDLDALLEGAGDAW